MSMRSSTSLLAVPFLLAASALATPVAAQVGCTLICPANITVATPPGAQVVTVSYTTPVAQGTACTGSPIQTAGLPPGAAFSIGVTTNVWSVAVAGAAPVTCQWTVTVTGTPAAPISVPTNTLGGLVALLAGLFGIGLFLRRRSA
jgi:hypothetical protein